RFDCDWSSDVCSSDLAMRFIPSDCKLDDAADLARCKTVEDPTLIGRLASKPAALVIEDVIQPEGTPVAFSGFPVNALTPYTARRSEERRVGKESRSR